MAKKEAKKESRHIQKARSKLKKRLQMEHRHFTTEALEEMTKRIRQTIIRHHPEMGYLKSKKFSLFDENHHTAKTKSKYILKMQKMLYSSRLL